MVGAETRGALAIVAVKVLVETRGELAIEKWVGVGVLVGLQVGKGGNTSRKVGRKVCRKVGGTADLVGWTIRLIFLEILPPAGRSGS